jgi:predicted transcriptional regulator
MDEEIKSRLEAEAKRRDRSASWIATKAIESYLHACEVKRDAIEKALAEADKGVFISSDAMNSWVDTWGTDKEGNLPGPDISVGGNQ